MPFLCLLLTIIHTIITANAVVVGRNPITLELSRVVNATGMRNLVAHDRARAKAMREKAWRFKETPALTHEPIINDAFAYVAVVGVGSPPTPYRLIVDTGSSNTWVGAGIQYVSTSTSTKTDNKVSVTYGLGGFLGTEYIDQVTLTPKLVIPNQSIGVASFAVGFRGVDGILGIGPVGLTIGTLSPNSTSSVPTVTDNLYTNGVIRNNEIGVYFRPSKSPLEIHGELSWGGTNSLKIVSPVTYIPVTTTLPACKYWGIDQSIQYGTYTILSTNAGIVDTGTTLILIATDAYDKYVIATGAVFDRRVGLLSITPAQYANLKSLYFISGGASFELIPDAQIWPRSLNTLIGGKSSSIYLIVADIGFASGQGFDFVNGFSFLQRYYSVYDSTSKRVGFAVTRHTKDETN